MNVMMPRRILYIVALVMASLIGLVYIQVSWIKMAVQVQEEEFGRQVHEVLDQVTYTALEDPQLLASLTAAYRYNRQHPQQALPPHLSQPIQKAARQLIDAQLSKLDVDMDFNLTMFASVGCVKCLKKQTATILTSSAPTAQVDREELLRHHIHFPLDAAAAGPGNEVARSERSAPGITLGIYFPGQHQHVLWKVHRLLLLSLLFIALLVACFIFTLKMLNRQRKLGEMKNNFINNMTHELKTPIFSISVALKVFRNNLVPTHQEKYSKYLDIIEAENNRLKSQAEKVLQIASLENNKLQLETEELDLHALIEEVSGLFTLIAEQQQGRIILKLKATKTKIQADRTHLLNVFYNLLDNAFKYADQKPLVEIGTRDTNQGIDIWVKDNGIGIQQSNQRFVFDKFYRVPTGNLHKVKGFGLGLSYTKLVVEAHQGQIALQSKPGRGTQFDIYFPVRKAV